MLKLQAVTTRHPRYGFIENLLHTAFPAEERRNDRQQREYTDNHPAFTAFLITEDEQEIGLITLWRFPEFTYVEHLAITPEKRNGGYGALILDRLKTENKGLIVLEVEEPTDEMSRRRIGFYERCGFRLCSLPYKQPPYHVGNDELPMHLMFYGTFSLSHEQKPNSFGLCRGENFASQNHEPIYMNSLANKTSVAKPMDSIDPVFNRIRDTLHFHVYGVKKAAAGASPLT